MTAIEDIREGDQVRATSKTNDDMAEFTVVGRSAETPWLYSENNVYLSKNFTFEVLKRAEKPLPTVPGLYSVREKDTDIRDLKRLLRTTHGEWFWIDFTALHPTVVAQKEDTDYLTDPTNNFELTLVYGGAQ